MSQEAKRNFFRFFLACRCWAPGSHFFAYWFREKYMKIGFSHQEINLGHRKKNSMVKVLCRTKKNNNNKISDTKSFWSSGWIWGGFLKNGNKILIQPLKNEIGAGWQKIILISGFATKKGSRKPKLRENQPVEHKLERKISIACYSILPL